MVVHEKNANVGHGRDAAESAGCGNISGMVAATRTPRAAVDRQSTPECGDAPADPKNAASGNRADPRGVSAAIVLNAQRNGSLAARKALDAEVDVAGPAVPRWSGIPERSDRRSRPPPRPSADPGGDAAAGLLDPAFLGGDSQSVEFAPLPAPSLPPKGPPP
jgi:hypothetical protein